MKIRVVVFVTSDLAFYIYIGGVSSSMDPAVMHCHVSRVAQNGLLNGLGAGEDASTFFITVVILLK